MLQNSPWKLSNHWAWRKLQKLYKQSWFVFNSLRPYVISEAILPHRSSGSPFGSGNGLVLDSSHSTMSLPKAMLAYFTRSADELNHVREGGWGGETVSRAANLQNTFSVFCWKKFRIFNNFSVSLNLFLISLKPVIMATSYLLWWDPLASSGNSSGFFRYYRNRKWGRARVTTTCGREKN